MEHSSLGKHRSKKMSDDEGSEWLIQMLKDVQLEQFYVRIRDELQVEFVFNYFNKIVFRNRRKTHCMNFVKVSRIPHFDYVTQDDLEKIGMGKPGARRLMEAIKKRKNKIRNKNFKQKILPPGISQQKSKSSLNPDGTYKKKRLSMDNSAGTSTLTCLIQEKVKVFISRH